MPITIATFYRFVPLTDVFDLRQRWLTFGQALGLDRLRGTLYVASEGINATIATVDAATLNTVLAELQPYLADTAIRTGTAEHWPFQRWRVRRKREIVSMGTPNVVEPDTTPAAVHTVDPATWNALIRDPELQLVDTRNDFEVAIGSFQGATDPKTEHFREFPDYVRRELDPERPVAMFCTGGIRCSKATAWMAAQGFREIYQLEGGILNYLQQIPEPESLWQGECFVFDERVAVGHGLQPGHYQICPTCGRPILNTCVHCQP